MDWLDGLDTTHMFAKVVIGVAGGVTLRTRFSLKQQ